MEIRRLCDISDIVFLQETWLASQELASLSCLDEHFYAQGVSAMDSSAGVLRGRPHGGLAILWRKSLGGCKVLNINDNRLMCIEVNNGNKSMAFINVYLPVDSYENLDEYHFYLAKLNNFVEEHHSHYVAMFGDFNTNYKSGAQSLFAKELSKFCTDEHYIITDLDYCDSTSFTFYSAAHNSVSWLDHFVCTINTHRIVKPVNIHYDFMSSDHFPMSIDLDIAKICIDNEDIASSTTAARVPWQDLAEADVKKYEALTDHHLSNIKLSHRLLLCDDINCKDPSHISDLDRMYEDIIESLRVSGEELINQQKKSNHRPIAGWNEYCKEAHSNARDAFLIWTDNNKPRFGPISDTMRKTRVVFKQAIRQCRAMESRAHADSLARKLLSRNPKQFWKEVQHMNGKDEVSLASTVGHVTGQTNIAEMWKEHFTKLLNSTITNAKKQTVLDKLGSCSSLNEPLTALEVTAAIKNLKKGKACGLDHLQGEHFKFSCTKITVLLSLCFNAMLSHGHLCQQLMNTIIVPIIKDKKGDVTDADNYRPIAITSVTSKLFETVFLTRFSSLLSTCDNQFGFKSSHSTDMCVFVLNQMTESYTSSSSRIFICYLDVSKHLIRLFLGAF